MDIFKDAETWVAIAFILFIIILLRFGWSRIVSALDNRAELIKQELDEARNLREQAQSLLADYQRKKQNSEKEIATIIEKAKTETENNIQIENAIIKMKWKPSPVPIVWFIRSSLFSWVLDAVSIPASDFEFYEKLSKKCSKYENIFPPKGILKEDFSFPIDSKLDKKK